MDDQDDERPHLDLVVASAEVRTGSTTSEWRTAHTAVHLSSKRCTTVACLVRGAQSQPDAG